MPTSEIERGMTGVGRTVFVGTEIEEFQVEILGVMKNSRPQGDLILARLSGGPLETTGVISGMSGSPVYIDGKLIGAVAYAWGFAKEPVCGIQPIGRMVSTWDRGLEVPASRGTSYGANALNDNIPAAWYADWLKDNHKNQENTENGSEYPVSGFRPLPVPLAVSGAAPGLMETMSPLRKDFGLMPVASGGSYAPADEEVPFVPGAVLGVPLVTGDLNATAIGTLTYVDGDRIVGFGHPMFSAGGVDLPMASGEVHTCLANQEISFKLGAMRRIVGSIRQDRNSAIAGVIGQMPPMIPMTVSLGGEGTENRTFNYEIIRDAMFSSLFANYALSNTILDTQKSLGEFSADVKYRIELDGYDPIENRSYVSGRANMTSMVGGEVMQVLSALQSNPFRNVDIKNIAVDISLTEELELVRISGLRLREKTVRPGEELSLRVELTPFKGEKKIRKIGIKLPDDMKDGNYMLTVSDAMSRIMREQFRAPARYRATSFSRLLELINMDFPDNQMYITVMSFSRGLVADGREMPSVPASVMTVIGSSQNNSPDSGITFGDIVVDMKEPMSKVVQGIQAVRFRVDHKTRI